VSERAFPVVFAGHVDHGKSTLVARLVLDTGGFPDGRLDELRRASERRGVPLELSFLLDAFQVERDQAVTIDASRVWFRSPQRRYEVIDAPGHREFVRHAVSAAGDARAAVLVVDAREGVSEQTRRHALLLPLLGVRDAIVVVNKMDAVDFARERFDAVAGEARTLAQRTGLELRAIVPAVARDGDGVVARGARMPWHEGPTLLEALDALPEARRDRDVPMRLPVQDVYRRDEVRIAVGTVDEGVLRAGDDVVILPSGEGSHVEELIAFPAAPERAPAGTAIGVRLRGVPFVRPGDVLADPAAVPAIAEALDVTVFWLGEERLAAGDFAQMRCGTRDTGVVVERIDARIDVATGERVAAEALERNEVYEVRLRCTEPAIVETRPASSLGRFALYRGDAIGGGGLVRAVVNRRARRSSPNVAAQRSGVDAERRAARWGHRGAVVWLTGLPSAGKSTLARELEAALFAAGWNTYVLDGDTVRTGLNGDLGFSAEDRRENVRRVGEVAGLFADSGAIAIVALVSPNAADRDAARAVVPGRFHEVYVRADRATCEARDAKGLYRRAHAGEIADFTGVTAPYEPPAAPELVVDTARRPVEDCAAELVAYVRRVAANDAAPAGAPAVSR